MADGVFVEKSIEALSSLADDAKEHASQIGQAVLDQVDESRAAAASALRNVSETMHKKAKHLPAGRTVTHSSADKLSSAAGYIAKHDSGEMLADAGSFLSRNPMKTLLLGMMIGCTVGWLLRRR